MKTALPYILVGILICICAFLFVRGKGTKQIVISHTDTVYIHHTFIDTLPVIKYKYRTKYVTDTLMSVDSVQVPVIVPISQSLYAKTITSDSDTISYRAYVSGYKTSLDSLRFRVNYNRYINRITISQPRKHFYFSHGIQAGIGYGLFSRKPDLFVGYGVTFNF